MSADRYLDALTRVLVHEGGYVNDPRDPGGATMKGVTQRTFDGHLRRLGKPSRPVRSITTGEIGAIYRGSYWNAVRGDELPEGVDYVLFDGAVNSGPLQSIKWLQRALGVKVDGNLSDATLAAAENYPDHDALVAAILERRLAFLKSLRTWRAFGKGWNRRVVEVRQIGQAWASGSVGPQPTYFAGMERRGLLSDAKAAPSPAIADAITGGGIVSTVVDQSVAALSPLQDAMPVVGKVVGVLTAVGGVAAALGLAYRWYVTRRSTALADALDLHRDTSPVPAAPANDDVPAAPASAAPVEQKEAA